MMSADSSALPLSSRLLRSLRVERQEARPTFLLALFLLLGMAAVICLKAVSDAVFLSEFNAARLPYVDLAITVLVGFSVNYYLRWSSRVPLGTLVASTQLGLAASVLLFWLLLTAGASWAPILLYLWVGVFAILIPSQIWSMAAASFTTRQAKRLFALIGSGGILGAAVGGNFTGFVGPRIGAAAVLPVAALFLLGGAWIARILSKGKVQQTAKASPVEDSTPILVSARLIRNNRYLLLIALAVVASTIVGTLVKYQFKAVAQLTFEADRDGMASFAGYFYGYIAVLSFLFHSTLSTRLLRWAGLSLTLFILPLAMLSGLVALLFSSSLMAAVWARGADQGFRHSIDRSSSELLWVPVAGELRNLVKSFMDVVVSRGADGLASLVLLGLLYLGHTTTRQISWVSLIFLAAWLAVLWRLRGAYLQTLRTAIERPDISAEQLLQRLAATGPSEQLGARLASSDPHAVEVAVGFAQFSGLGAAQAQLASLLTHESAAIRRKAMTTIASLQAEGCEPEVLDFLRLETDFDLRQTAFEYLDDQDPLQARETQRALLAEPDRSLAAMAAARLIRSSAPEPEAAALFEDVVATLSQGEPQEQVQAARLLGMVPNIVRLSTRLSALLDSEHPAVVRAAIESTGILGREEDLPRLIRLLSERHYGSVGRRAVAAYGELAIPALSVILRDDGAPQHLQRQAARVLGSIGGRQAGLVLFAYLRRSHEAARPDVLRALSRIREKQPGLGFNKEIVNLLLRSALQRFYQAAALREGVRGNEGPAIQFLAQTLLERQNRWLDEAFVLLGFVFPQREMRDARYRIRSGQRDLRSNALEFLDSRLIGHDIRPLLLPAIEEQDSRRILQAAKSLFDLDPAPYPSVLRRLLDDTDSWLQACACHAAAEMGQTNCKPRIIQLTRHPDLLLRETALAASARL